MADMTPYDSQMLKGLVSFLLLDLVAAETDYGYSLVVRLHERGFTELAEGTVYPALSRAEQSGWIDAVLVPSEKGPARKYYKITPAGNDERRRARDAWERLAQLVDAFAADPRQPESKEK
jgi:PadR family transcriptional regulator PadR